jgi:hypothetical protein
MFACWQAGGARSREIIASVMRIQLLPAATAVLLTSGGLALLFAPEEVGSLYGVAGSVPSSGLLQAFGAALLGLAAMNWTSRFSVLGGLHGRAIVSANFFHFAIGLAVFARAISRGSTAPLWISAAVYGAAAVAHGMSFFIAPKATT